MKWIKCSDRKPDLSDKTILRQLSNKSTFENWRFALYDKEDIEWLDESDNSDLEAAFNAAITKEWKNEDYPYGDRTYKYPTFQDYLDSLK